MQTGINPITTTISELGVAYTPTIQLLTALIGQKYVGRLLTTDIYELRKKTVQEIESWGLTKGKATMLCAALALGTRCERKEKQQIRTSADVYNLLAEMEFLTYESFKVIGLNKSHSVMFIATHTIGGIDSTMVDVRLILKSLILAECPAFCIAHNHPSGNIQPSDADDALTKRINEAAKIHNIKLLDHVIIGSNAYFSYADNGRL